MIQGEFYTTSQWYAAHTVTKHNHSHFVFFARAIPPAEPGQAGPDKMAAPAASALSAWWGEGQLLCDSVGHRLGTKKYTGFS